MSDLVRVLRGQRIDGRGADEIMRRAADEIDRLRVIEQTEAANARLTCPHLDPQSCANAPSRERTYCGHPD